MLNKAKDSCNTVINKFEHNNFPLDNGFRLIEASAGTGKTFALARLVLRLITEKEYLINQILVITFTEAAASKIIFRIVPKPNIFIGSMASPSPDNIALKNILNTINGMP